MKNKNTIHSDTLQVEFLFRKYYRTLCAYAFRFVNDTATAENIVQDVFFELWNKREILDFNLAIKTYLFKSVYHRALNHLNSVSVSKQTSLDQLEEKDDLSFFLISQEKNGEYWLMMEELDKEIQAIINQFPPQCKQVFLLSRQNELKNKEIAEQLGISVKAVEKQITKAIATLRKELKGKGILLLLYLFFY
ncbi:RNA polymerase sigma-70 factor [Parabacteroides sp. 52]|uniref:RNA polymerase sigma-70 factor n=1 Tax=unclassified Parabacteroides TaxID=2649774 RepID=UPI0013D6873D|nr:MULTISPECIES: RNA polymerase sigma-70 factor [unclassified Parabacteroides]MDH6533513.1 RNA polymerase sigma-70 factor (family 1) [Parabacteroides sp. PM5-20]NDV54266.1 RNA polymerase sigma-70 factor [Parabacteroides sp. 52]